MSGIGFGIEDCGLSWHIAVHHAKFFRVRRPRNVMDWAVFVCLWVSTDLSAESTKQVPRSILESKPPLALRRYKVVSPS